MDYGRFLQELHELLVEGIRVAENEGWHHAAEGSEVYQHRLRLGTWLSTLEERIARYGDSRKKVQARIRSAGRRSPT